MVGLSGGRVGPSGPIASSHLQLAMSLKNSSTRSRSSSHSPSLLWEFLQLRRSPGINRPRTVAVARCRFVCYETRAPQMHVSSLARQTPLARPAARLRRRAVIRSKQQEQKPASNSLTDASFLVIASRCDSKTANGTGVKSDKLKQCWNACSEAVSLWPLLAV